VLCTRLAREELTAAFAQVASSVSVVTTVTDDDVPVGATVGSLTSVSLDPPLVLVCLSSTMFLPTAIARRGRFAVSVLSAGERDMAERFAGLTPGVRDRFEGVAARRDRSGMPVLPGSVAWLGCELWATYDGGDHRIVVGQVGHLRRWPGRDPLLRHDRGWVSVDSRAAHNGPREGGDGPGPRGRRSRQMWLAWPT
jgi:flavin reductase (DIM6/NTAB) family NADH-FMN oxidoreductase RutF